MFRKNLLSVVLVLLRMPGMPAEPPAAPMEDEPQREEKEAYDELVFEVSILMSCFVVTVIRLVQLLLLVQHSLRLVVHAVPCRPVREPWSLRYACSLEIGKCT